MDRSELFDEYLKDSEKDKTLFDNYQDYYSALIFRIHDSKSMVELKKELNTFFMQNNVPAELYSEMVAIYELNAVSEDVHLVVSRLEEYLKSKVDELEKESTVSSQIVKEIKEEVVEETVFDLEQAGVNVVGDEDELLQSIESQEDIDKLKENVEKTADYLHEREQLVSNDDESFEITVDKIQDSLEMPGENGILNSVIESEEVSEDIGDLGLSFENGMVSLYGDNADENSMNFMMMMTAALLLPDTMDMLFDNLGMQMVKDNSQTTQFKVEFGKFPVVGHPENHLDKVAISKVVEVARTFQPSADYSMVLSEKSPELFLACQLFQNHILNTDGAARIAVKREDDDFRILFGLDEKLEAVSESFSTNGADVNRNPNGAVVQLGERSSIERIMVLSNTIETLDTMSKEREGQMTLDKERGAYVKKYTMDSSNVSNEGKANTLTLILVVTAEILAVAFSLFFLF